MTQYIEIDPDGFAVGLYDDCDAPPAGPEGYAYYPMEPPMQFIPDGPTASQRLKWAGEGMPLTWHETATLEQIKARKKDEVTAAYLLANRTSFTFAGKEIQADAHAMNQITVTTNGILRRGALREDWSGYWKALDNTYVAIPDMATWWQLCDAIEATGQANFNRAQAIKAQIDAATTAEEVEAIQWAQVAPAPEPVPEEAV